MAYDHEAYLRTVRLQAEQALVHTEMLRRCERHHDSLLSTGTGGPAERAARLANIWMEDEGGDVYTLADLRDAIAIILADAQPECVACAQDGDA